MVNFVVYFTQTVNLRIFIIIIIIIFPAHGKNWNECFEIFVFIILSGEMLTPFVIHSHLLLVHWKWFYQINVFTFAMKEKNPNRKVPICR